MLPLCQTLSIEIRIWEFSMGLYEFIIKDKTGNILASLDSARNRSWEVYLNRVGSASFTVHLADPKVNQDLLLLGNKEIYVYRNGVLVWGGELINSRSELPSCNVQINAKGFFDLLSKKYIGTAATPRVFTNTDLSTILSTIISEVQTGTTASFGLISGSLATSRNADRSYEYKNVKEAIEGLSNLNIKGGIDFEFDANKQFSTFYPQKGRTRDDIVFEYGKNILSFVENLDATEMANEVIVLGEGQGTELVTVTRDASSGIQSAYKIRQKVISFKDVNKTSTLNDHGDQELIENQTQKQIISLKTKGNLEPTLGSYAIGDSVRVIVKYGYMNIDSYFRIYGIRVQISDEDDEDIELIFNPV